MTSCCWFEKVGVCRPSGVQLSPKSGTLQGETQLNTLHTACCDSSVSLWGLSDEHSGPQGKLGPGRGWAMLPHSAFFFFFFSVWLLGLGQGCLASSHAESAPDVSL